VKNQPGAFTHRFGVSYLPLGFSGVLPNVFYDIARLLSTVVGLSSFPGMKEKWLLPLFSSSDAYEKTLKSADFVTWINSGSTVPFDRDVTYSSLLDHIIPSLVPKGIVNSSVTADLPSGWPALFDCSGGVEGCDRVIPFPRPTFTMPTLPADGKEYIVAAIDAYHEARKTKDVVKGTFSELKTRKDAVRQAYPSWKTAQKACETALPFWLGGAVHDDDVSDDLVNVLFYLDAMVSKIESVLGLRKSIRGFKNEGESSSEDEGESSSEDEGESSSEDEDSD
jgi:hypothetical protein